MSWYEIIEWFYMTPFMVNFSCENVTDSIMRVSYTEVFNDEVISKTFYIGSLEKKAILRKYKFYHSDTMP